MPRPVYVLLANTAASDSTTGRFSVIEIVDKIAITPLPVPKEGEKVIVVRHESYRAIAVWLIEEDKGDKYEDEYEHGFRFHMPLAEQPHPAPTGRFSFGKPERLPFHRFDLRLEGPLPYQGPGVMRLEHRIKKVGTDVWLSQDFPLLIEAVTFPDTGAKLPAPLD